MDYYEWEDIKKMISEREKNLICEPNVIHLQYTDGILCEPTIEDFENMLKGVGLELSRYKIRERNVTSIDRPLFKTFFLIAHPLINELIKDTRSKKWELIKKIILITWKNAKKKACYNTISDINKNELNIGLKVNLDRNTNYSFTIAGNLKEESILNTFDKILFFLQEQRCYEKYRIPNDLIFDVKESKWIIVNE